MAPVRRATMVFRAALEPMLINAMMTVMEREKRMLLTGTGVPITATCLDVSGDDANGIHKSYLAEPR